MSTTPWRYERSFRDSNTTTILYDSESKILGIVDNEDIAKLIVHAVNTVPQLHMNQLMKATPEEDGPPEPPADVVHTTCKWCGQDIESLYPRDKGSWYDRGNNQCCASGINKDNPHTPY